MKSFWKASGKEDIDDFVHLTWYLPCNCPSRKIGEIVGETGRVFFGNYRGYPFTRAWFKLFPDLKKYVSLWHIVLQDLMIAPFSGRESPDSLDELFGENWKIVIYFLDSYLVIVKRR